MKKIKLIIMTLAVALSIGGAFATSPHVMQSCQSSPQYYFNGTNYVAAGVYGINYLCITSSATCTYYKVGGQFVPCMSGNYCTSNCRTVAPTPKNKN